MALQLGYVYSVLQVRSAHDLASFTKKQGFGARSARLKPLFFRCKFENFAKSYSVQRYVIRWGKGLDEFLKGEPDSSRMMKCCYR
jgi:hypothetical protein